MPALQWLGDIEKETEGGYLAKALGGALTTGVSSYLGQKEKGRESAIKEREMGMQQSELDLRRKQLEHDYSKLDYDKRKEMYDTMVKLLPSIAPDKQMELTSTPEWMELEKSLGIPSLSGSTVGPETAKPGWSNEQNVEAVRTNLIRKRVGPKRDMFGISEPKELVTLQDAIDHITEENLNPEMFKNELSQYQTETATVGKGGEKKVTVRPANEYKVGEKKVKDGVTYTYKGNGKWSY